jgi:secreted trypsin-like serine protease
MRVLGLPLLSLTLISAAPANAVVRGEVARDPNGVRTSVVRVESSTGELCSGAIIAPDLVLTAAHCVVERASYRIVAVNRAFRPIALRAIAAAMHPAFVSGTTPRTQPGVDLAILKLEQPLGGDFVPLSAGGAGGIAKGEPVELAGYGIVAEGKAKTARTLRQTQLVALGSLQVANKVAVVADSERLALSTGAGACRGDSGGPILRASGAGYQLVGIVSWSSGAFNGRNVSACGGLTAVTPIAEHASWIAARASELASLSPAQAIYTSSARRNAADWIIEKNR